MWNRWQRLHSLQCSRSSGRSTKNSRRLLAPQQNQSSFDVARLYLLDTNVLSHLVRQPQGPVAQRIADVGEANVLTSVIVACELRFGAARRGSRRLTRQVDAVLGALTIRPLESDIERVYASIRVALEKKGTPIGAHDMLIAAHARAIDAICVTDNVAEFKRVPALKVENWLR